MPPEPAQTPSPDSGDGTPGGQAPPAFADFDEFLAAQTDEVRALYAAKTAGLTTALDKEREKAKTASAQLREMAKTADPATADMLRKAADEKDAEIKALKTQLEFHAEASRLGCRALDKAWAYAQATGMSAKEMKADPDFAAWFAAPPSPPGAKGNAGNGVGSQPGGPLTMDQLIRAPFGRG